MTTTTDSYVLETRELTKRYGDVLAVDHLTMRVEPGEVYGFLGPNGAGKTTTMRMLLGLVAPTSGTAVVLGASPGSPAGLKRVGALIESPGFWPFLSGRDNLLVVARHAGVADTGIDQILDEVDLADRAGDKFGTYSQGMKQRLGVGAALLKDPDLLVLDEPTNGLDPAGVAQMRALIGRLGGGRRSVLLSSHMLTEVEQVCRRVGVIRDGRLVAEGTVDELRGGTRLRVKAEPVDRALTLLTEIAGPSAVTRHNGSLLVNGPVDAAPALARALIAGDVDLHELAPERATLEDVFFELTDLREEAS
jgi:ABC-2 type transport system ATP-binding protein